jgi:hypothetical protein
MSTKTTIVEASGLVGLLLVFAFGYFAAILPVALGLIEIPRPDVGTDRSALASRIRGYATIVAIILVLDLVIAAWLTPLTVDTIRTLSFSGPFATIEVGLLVMDLMLTTLLVATAWLLAKLVRRRRVVLGQPRS